MNKEECLEALDYLATGQCSYCWKSTDKGAVEHTDSLIMLRELINEHFDSSVGFSNFKLYADSTLKSLTKNELIDYIHMIYHNWKVCDGAYKNVVRVNYELQKENDYLKSYPSSWE